jgi:hypothetical protein
MKGNAAKMATAASFHPKANEMEMQPSMTKMDTSGKTPLMPKRSWSCLAELERLDVKDPLLLEAESKKGTGFRTRLVK